MPPAAYIGNYQWRIHRLHGAAATGIEAGAGVLAMAAAMRRRRSLGVSLAAYD
jgi:hypothetical protein